MMKLTILIPAFSAFVECTHVLHEAREAGVHSSWHIVDRVQPDAIIPVRIGLKQSNLELGPGRLEAISHPGSKDYGKHLSMKEVHDLFAPSPDIVSAVYGWLLDAGLDKSIIAHSDNKGWLAANVPAQDAERLFQTELYEYEHFQSGHIRIGCDQYHVPAHLAERIDYVTPGVKMSATLKKRTHKRDGRWSPGHWKPKGPMPHPVGPWNGEPWHMPPAARGLPPDVQNCGVNITPPCWRALYGLPMPYIHDSVNDLGLFEQGDYFAQSDVSTYFAKYAPNVPPSTAPKVLGVDGGEAPVAASSDLNSGESDLDIEIVTSLIHPQPVVVYQVDDQVYSPEEVAVDNTFNTFLDALDGSYCNYTAYGITGDSPEIDPTYPDPAAGGYEGQRQCGVYKPTRVISISYAQAESDFPKKYVQRQCNEFMKLSLQGHTILAGSGDFGVGTPPGDPTESGCLSENGQNQTIYSPGNPSGCPWITSVGATRLYANQTVKDRESAMQVDLYRPGRPDAFHYFASGGGFSNYFSTAWYQKEAVSAYFANHDPKHPYYIVNSDASNVGANGGIYNRAGRGYPDVSANGANMLAVINSTVEKDYGTSLSAPIWAATVTLLNQQRTIAGKGPIGFLNPVLYENPWVLNDIVNGSNPNCGSSGFKSVPGWDPVTGLGTPNYPKMLALFLSLP